MKKCHRCGAPWKGLRGEPREREVCEVCRAYLHSCVNCHHFDHVLTSACKLPHTFFVGSREAMNYCDDFKMTDSIRRTNEDRVNRARVQWEELFRK